MYPKRFITFHFSSNFFSVNDLPILVGSFAYIAPSETEWYCGAGCCWSITKSCVILCDPLGLQHIRLHCPLPPPRVCPSSYSLNQWCHPTISSSVALFFSLQPFPTPGSFPTCRLFASDGQSIGASVLASVLPVNIQGWFPFSTDWFDLLVVQGLFKSLLQQHSSKASILWGLLSLWYMQLNWQLKKKAQYHKCTVT